MPVVRGIRALACLMLLLSASAGLAQDSPTVKFRELLSAEWERWLKDHPDMATVFGFARYNDSWPDVSLDAYHDRQTHYREVLQQLRTIPVGKLHRDDQVHYVIFQKETELALEAIPHDWHLLPLNQREGIQDLSSLIGSISFQTVKDYEDWLTRMEKFPDYMDQTIELLKEGVHRGRVHPRTPMLRVPGQVRKHLVEDPEQSPFYGPFRKFPERVRPADRERLAGRARELIGQQVVPAYRKLIEFLEDIYLPRCQDEVGVWRLPAGKEVYEFQVRMHTSTRLTPDEIHQLGLEEVKRIRAEMEKVIKQTGFQGPFEEFVADLRTNPRFYFKKPDELMAACKEIYQKVEEQLPRLFRKLPRTPCVIEPIPALMAADTTSAYYLWPSADGRRPGTYYLNLSKIDMRPRYQLEALTLHEAVPGHHLQIALAFEMENLPAFRRYSTGHNAFVEGWGLYGESLGEALGMYRDPYSKFGQLSFEMWRAIRLVVDTGMHAKQWTRQQAIDYFTANSASSQHDIEAEVDRYATWPGQALGYKIGELAIKKLRKQAEETLKDRFDLKAFHEVVLQSGAVPLEVLETNVGEWIALELQRR